MKKIGFVMQVLIVIISLPVLTILELKHTNGRPAAKKAYTFTVAPTEKNSVATTSIVAGKMPS